MQKTAFHEFELFCRKKSFQSLNAQNHFLELLRTPILCLVQLSKLRECEATDAQKLLSQSEKLLNVILRAKLNYMKNVSSNEMNCFLQCRRQHFMSLSFLQKKSFRA